ncbi:MAG: 3-hydroxyacyl-CoA dehydrogenase [Alphaproteobacteria bacterium HGW-Alphaproteobacteria-1]|jgi:NAD(P)-dependent dehydrogenase (short-subunit alcohol dehydrogenase family)|nr:MAG: 3-hydroxyacyl-CoA dehydrogenase [Alphaproteobacteria bacterium HGW-Alphaproteobacteria-1]
MRRVLVTGGGSGIGRAIARAFAGAGDEVTIAGRRPGPLQETAEGHDMDCRLADVTDEAQIEALFERPYDVVIANAGTGRAGKLSDVTLDDWTRTLAVNLTGTFLTFRAGLRGMGAGGRLIAIASTAALKGNATVPAYAAAKHGVLGLVRSVALDVARSGITCNAICPGFTETDMAETAITGLMQRFDVDRDKATAMVVAGNPMRRLIAPEEVAAAALYLASPGAGSINGHALSVSGGEA